MLFYVIQVLVTYIMLCNTGPEISMKRIAIIEEFRIMIINIVG